MVGLVTKVPPKNRKSISGGLLRAGIAGSFGLLFFFEYADATEEKCTGHLFWKECRDAATPMSSRRVALVCGVFFIGVAAFYLVSSLRLARMAGHENRYLNVLAGVETLRIQEIADTTGLPPVQVRTDLQSMINSEMITDFYIDYGADQVVSTKFVPKTSHKTVVKCSACGGNNELIVGVTRNCAYCEQPLQMGSKRAE